MIDNKLREIEEKIAEEDYERARELLESIDIERLPGEVQLQYFFLLAKVYFEFDQNDQVMPMLSRVLENSKEFSEIDRAYLLAACLHMDEAEKEDGEQRVKHLQEAENYFNKIKKLENLNHEEHRIYYFQRALLELYLNRLEKSADYFETALRMHDSDEDQCVLHTYLADVYKDLKQYEKAIEHYDLAIKKTSPSEEREIAFLSINKARILDTIKRHEEANRVIFSLLNEFEVGRQKEDAEVSMYCHDILGYTFYSLKNYEESLKHFNMALELAKTIGKDQTHYLYESSTIYRLLGNFETAERKAKEALITNNDTYIQLIYVELFRQYMYSDRYEKAIEMLETLIRRYPDYEDLGWVYLMTGHMYSLLEKHHQAIEYFKKALEVLDEEDEDYVSARDFMAYCYVKLGEIDRAMDICLDIIEKYPDGPNLAWTHAVLARCYFEKGMKIQAQEEAEKAQRYKKPTSEVYSYAQNVLGDILKDLGIR